MIGPRWPRSVATSCRSAMRHRWMTPSAPPAATRLPIRAKRHLSMRAGPPGERRRNLPVLPCPRARPCRSARRRPPGASRPAKTATELAIVPGPDQPADAPPGHQIPHQAVVIKQGAAVGRERHRLPAGDRSVKAPSGQPVARAPACVFIVPTPARHSFTDRPAPKVASQRPSGEIRDRVGPARVRVQDRQPLLVTGPPPAARCHSRIPRAAASSVHPARSRATARWHRRSSGTRRRRPSGRRLATSQSVSSLREAVGRERPAVRRERQIGE